MDFLSYFSSFAVIQTIEIIIHIYFFFRILIYVSGKVLLFAILSRIFSKIILFWDHLGNNNLGEKAIYFTKIKNSEPSLGVCVLSFFLLGHSKAAKRWSWCYNDEHDLRRNADSVGHITILMENWRYEKKLEIANSIRHFVWTFRTLVYSRKRFPCLLYMVILAPKHSPFIYTCKNPMNSFRKQQMVWHASDACITHAHIFRR